MENKTIIENDVKENRTAQQEIIKVDYSALTRKLIARDTKRAERKRAKAEAKAAKVDNQIPKWKKIIGWLGGGLAIAGAVTFGVLKVMGGDDEEEVEDPEETAEEDRSDTEVEDVE